MGLPANILMINGFTGGRKKHWAQQGLKLRSLITHNHWAHWSLKKTYGGLEGIERTCCEYLEG